jgi:hypothetical protein
MKHEKRVSLNSKFQSSKSKGMSKLKIQNIWPWGLGFDLAFELRALAFDPYPNPGKPSLIKQRCCHEVSQEDVKEWGSRRKNGGMLEEWNHERIVRNTSARYANKVLP